jgi:hypothetical protein
MAREMKSDRFRARICLSLLACASENRLTVDAAGTNPLTIRRRLSYKLISSSTEDHDADDEDPDH